MKRSFVQSAIVSMLLYGCTTWTLNKRLGKRFDGGYTRMLRAILNRSWRQHPTKQHLYGHLPPITKTIQIRRTRHAVHYWRSEGKLISDLLQWTPTHGRAKSGWPTRTFIQRLCEDMECSPEDLPKAMNDRGSGISVLGAWQDDDDDDLNMFFSFLSNGYVHSRINSLRKSMHSIILPAKGRIVLLIFCNKDGLGIKSSTKTNIQLKKSKPNYLYISIICTLFPFFGLLSLYLSPCLSQRFGRCTLRPSSGGWDVQLNPLFRLPG